MSCIAYGLGDINGDGYDEVGFSIGSDLFLVWGVTTGANLTFDDLRASTGGRVLRTLAVSMMPFTALKESNSGKIEIRYGVGDQMTIVTSDSNGIMHEITEAFPRGPGWQIGSRNPAKQSRSNPHRI